MWDAARQVTVLMRTKEEADDYRYFPEPDLVPVLVEDSNLRLLAGSLPELPHAREKRLASQYGIPAYDAGVLAGSAALADLFEATAGLAGDPRSVSSWILTEVLGELNRRKTEVAGLGLAPAALAELLGLVHAGRISGRIAKEVFAEMVATGKGPGEIVQERGLFGINDAGLIREIARRVVAENPSSVEDLRRGKERAFRFLVGKVMEATGGRADPETVRDSLRAELKAGETGLTGAG
jgi:aspartyl-tRNA(Asn)/glutamyl-tRNA(Gln) amidotransferase subunit B